MPGDAIKRLIAERGSIMVDPPLLQPADVFLDLAGEDLRRRLFLTQGPDGAELCLRPDFTIPVCRLHLDGGAADRRAEYGYVGPIFRHRASSSGEVTQAGIESFGRIDREAADADTLAFALEACGAMGVAAPAIRIGDSSSSSPRSMRLAFPAPGGRACIACSATGRGSTAALPGRRTAATAARRVRPDSLPRSRARP
ncbi:MAG: ATP phosphoribosyltransferase regulatory subunit [Hyphomicrobiales bacterium]